LDTPFWRHAQAETDVSNVQPLIDFYRDNGPTGYGRFLLNGNQSDFGLEGYLVMLVGNKVPSNFQSGITPQQRALWQKYQRTFA
ncbi:hypothetical protein, partial [Streptococcus pseudopneumoniae]|uniref:hypothetical protein n=1 Tax=Streptococcus pseudopneumoniae TaxID=257758 RepID=UPI0019D573F3